MPWSANLDSVTKDPSNGNIIAVVTFTNGVETYTTNDIRAFDLTSEIIANIVSARLAVYEGRDMAFALLQKALGPVTPGVIPGSNPDPFQVARLKVAQLQGDVALGIRDAADPDLAAALVDAKAALAASVKAEGLAEAKIP